ncbi:MAG: hypothetical protein ACTSU5_16220 [Promethearchaeota archaeon]
MVDLDSPEFVNRVKEIVEQVLKEHEKVLSRDVLISREEFKEEMGKQREEMTRIWKEIRKQREEATRIWKEIQKQREEATRIWKEIQEQREEATSERDKIWKEIQKQREEATRIWKEIQKQREEATSERDKIWKEIQKQREEGDRNFKTIKAILIEMENKTGPELESLVLDVMRETLLLEKIDPAKIQKKFIVDREGVVYASNYSTEVDVVLENGNLYLVEVKATADNRDANDLLNKARLYEATQKRKPDGLVLVALRMNRMNHDFAREKGIRVIVGNVVP